MSVETVATLRERALAVLCDPSLAHVVELVGYPDGPDGIVVANAAGASRLSRRTPDEPATRVWGRDPVGVGDPFAFTPLTAELADPSPPAARNSYPYAGARLASLFAEPRAPDLAVVHTGRHHWPQRGGHLGEHGSLAVVQSRAPLVLAGAGVHARGDLPLAARVVDVGPTLGWLAGAPLGRLAGLDGAALVDLAVAGPARHVVGLLWDGVNANSLYALARAGELPAVARLLERGCHLRGGAVAEFPSHTLVNHTSALTGLGPGRHGIVANEFYDRAVRRAVVANSPATWHRAGELLRPGVRTVFELLGGAGTACVNEPTDRGAAYSTFALVRAGGASDGAAGMGSALPDAAGDPHATAEHVATLADYAFATRVDALGLTQACSLWESPENAPRLLWWNSMLTDTAHHEGGPHSRLAHDAMRDTDRRLGAFLDHLERVGGYDDTVFLLTADHGSEGADPACTGDWDVALRAEGIPFRDEAYGFLYLGHS